MRLLLCLFLFASARAVAQEDAPKRLATLVDADVDDFRVEGMPRTELMKLRFKLQESRPDIVAPLVMIGGGLVLDFVGFLGLVAPAIGQKWGRETFTTVDPITGDRRLSGVSYASLVTGSVLFVVGTLVAICGGVRLSRYLPVRRIAAFKIDLVNVELERLGPVMPETTPPPVP
jgi:hypothetical protein